VDGSVQHKRLGDGFYEQRQVLDQIAQLTGRRFLSDDTDALAQYRSLMDAGVQAAGAFDLSVGVAFTGEQMAALTPSVTEVSGIGAGNGGYQIHVGGNTDLTGAVIASTAEASKNLLDTGTLSYRDLENEASYSAIGGSVSIGRGGYGSGGSISVPQFDNQHSTERKVSGTIGGRGEHLAVAQPDALPLCR